jgi:hypothetical protein
MDPAIENLDRYRGIDLTLRAEENVGKPTDPLSLDIEDEELYRIIDKRIDDSKKFFNGKYDLDNRRKKNELYLFGREIKEKENRRELKDYEARVNDNVIYEIEASIKPLAMSRLPDLIIVPGDESDAKAASAEMVTTIIEEDMKERENRTVLGLAFKHLPVYYTGIIKYRWNPEKGDLGDYQFECVHPENVVVDSQATSNNANKMNMIAQFLTATVQDLIMRFPEKKKELLTRLHADGIVAGVESEPSWKEMATPVKYTEVWFTWYKSSKTGIVVATQEDMAKEPGAKWERIEGVAWKYGDVILKKIKNPNFDYEGVERLIAFDKEGEMETKHEVLPTEIMTRMMSGDIQDVQKETIYRNYFKQPEKPFFFMGYDQWGKIAYDETSRIEQNIRNQENLNKRGKQIIETLASRVKYIFSKDSGLKSEDIQQMDMDDPKQDLLVDGKVGESVTVIQAERPTPAEFKDLDDTRQRMYAISGSTAVRGSLQSDTATSNQIAREADFTRADDLVEDTINAASEWMARATLHMIKLRYSKEHIRRILGKKGEVLFLKLHQDMVDDGMEVMIKASGTDKLRTQRNAMDMAKLGAPFVNPLDFYRDMGIDDPEGRTERGMAFASDPNTYLAKFVLGMEDTQQMVGALQAQTPMVPQAPVVPPGGPQMPQPSNTAAVPINPPLEAPSNSPRIL